jgi:O-antigen/teichoic acid export membrane protein
MLASNTKFLLRGASATFILRISGVGFGFVTQAVLARLMGASEYGIYIYALTWINLLALAAKLGTENLSIRFCAAYSAKQEWGLLKGLMRRSLQTVFSASLLCCGVGVAIVLVIQKSLDEELFLSFMLGFLLLPVQTLSALRQATLQGLKQVVRGLFVELLARPLLLGFALLAYFGMDYKLEAPDAMVLTIASAICVFLLGSYWLLKTLPPILSSVLPQYENKLWGKTAFPFLWISGLRTLLNQADILLIGMFLDVKLAGIYAIASRIGELAAFGLQSANALLGPMVSELHALDKPKELQVLITRSARGVFIFTLILVIPLALLRTCALDLFGPEFVSGGTALLILLGGQTFNALTGSVGLLMSMTGYQTQAAKILFIATALNLGMNISLIPLLGLEGAALSSVASTLFWNIIMYIFVWKRLKIKASIF